ncbi:MAG: superoxide dismutase [Fe] [Sutterella wadsworthensis]|nr:superoxide dismutase [Fe] [Sutterella wadsworthensis]
MMFTLPALPYALDALEPYMSRETLEFHWGKHHQTYVNNLNNLTAGTAFEGKDLVEVIRSSEGGVFNNAAQVFNHTFFWNGMKPQGGGEPTGALLDAIVATWGSYAEFRKAFSAAAAGNFGSGWTWLVKNPDGTLAIVNTSNAGTPLTGEQMPLLNLDVWEHAYYIDHRNARPKFIDTFFDHLVNWSFAEKNFA